MAVFSEEVQAARGEAAEKKPEPKPQPSILALAFRLYMKNLVEKPVLTKSLTAGTLSVIADLLAQTLNGKPSIDFRRTLLLGLYGAVWSGPCGHFWQKILADLFPSKDPVAPIKKVLLDQLTYAPLQSGIFLSYLALVIERAPVGPGMAVVRAILPGVVTKGWRFWPAVQYVNQKYIPLQFRVLWINAFALMWGVFMMTRSKAS